MEPRYPFVAIDVPAAEADEIAEVLFDLGATGVEERDDQTLARGAGAGQITLVASFETHAVAEDAVAALRDRDPSLPARLEEIVGDAWRDAWKAHFEPFPLTTRITVAPPWADYAPQRDDEHVLLLEPGRAFGTGLHATTALVAELLDANAPSLAGRDLLDVGTGSGILALAALLLGAACAVAIDNDDDVIEVVRENAARNGLADRLAVSAGTVETVARAFPWVVANIEARVLRPLAPELARVVAPGGRLVLSGVLEVEHDDLVQRYTSLPRPLRHLGTTRRGEADDAWVAIDLAAPLSASDAPRLAP